MMQLALKCDKGILEHSLVPVQWKLTKDKCFPAILSNKYKTYILINELANL